MPLLAKILLASFISGVLALVGGMALFIWPRLIRRFALHFISFATGALLAAALLDLLPEALEFGQELGAAPERIFTAVLGGILVFFLLERIIFKYHPHHHGEGDGEAPHHHATPTLLAVGDTLHNFIDGVLIATTFLANPALGVLTAAAVYAHEVPQEIGDFTIMLYHGWSRQKVLWINIFSALASLAGAAAAYAARGAIAPFLPQALAFTAGVFVYIAGSDLIPDVAAAGGRDKVWQIAALVMLGVLAVWGLSALLE